MRLGKRQQLDAARGGEVVSHLLTASESSIELTRIATELAERCLLAADGGLPLSAQEILDYRKGCQQLRTALAEGIYGLNTIRAAFFQGAR